MTAMLVVCAALAACTTPAPAPEPPVPAVREADPVPTEDATAEPAVAAIVARPEALELRDAGGAVVATYDYLGDPRAAIDAVTELLGEAPVTEDHPGSSHFPPNTAHRWESLVLWEQRRDDRWANVEYSLFSPRFLVEFTGPSAFGIELTTTQGIHAGEPWPELLAEPGLTTNPSGCSGSYLEAVEVTGVNPDGGAYSVPVVVDFRPSADDAVIARIGAPVPALDGCA